MKLSLLALFLCIGLLVWNAWLQIQVNRISHSAPSTSSVQLPSELKLTKLEIVNDQGNTVITASADEKGLGLLSMKGIIASTGVVVGSEKGKVVMLTENRLEFDGAKGDAADKKLTPVAVIENDDGSGKLHLIDGDQIGTIFNAFPTGFASNDSKGNAAVILDSSGLDFDNVTGDGANKQFTPITSVKNDHGIGKLHLYDGSQPDTSLNADARGLHSNNAKDNTAFFLDGSGVEFDASSGTDTKQYTHVAALENYQGAGKLHLHDSSKPNLSFVAWVDGIMSMDSAANHVNWELPTANGNDAFLDVTKKDFSTVKSDVGTFLVSCQGVEPYLEGYKVHLQIGNPMAMLVSNPKITVEWGAALPKPGADIKDNNSAYQAWKTSLQQTSITLNSNLRPGFWNDVEIVVSPAKANELDHFMVSIQTDSVSLTHPPDQH